MANTLRLEIIMSDHDKEATCATEKITIGNLNG